MMADLSVLHAFRALYPSLVQMNWIPRRAAYKTRHVTVWLTHGICLCKFLESKDTARFFDASVQKTSFFSTTTFTPTKNVLFCHLAISELLLSFLYADECSGPSSDFPDQIRW